MKNELLKGEIEPYPKLQKHQILLRENWRGSWEKKIKN